MVHVSCMKKYYPWISQHLVCRSMLKVVKHLPPECWSQQSVHQWANCRNWLSNLVVAQDIGYIEKTEDCQHLATGNDFLPGHYLCWLHCKFGCSHLLYSLRLSKSLIGCRSCACTLDGRCETVAISRSFCFYAFILFVEASYLGNFFSGNPPKNA